MADTHSPLFFYSPTPTQIWDVREGRLLFAVHGHRGGVAEARFSPDAANTFFASAGRDDQVVMAWRANLASHLKQQHPGQAQHAAAAAAAAAQRGPEDEGRARPRRREYRASDYDAPDLQPRRIPRPAYQRPTLEQEGAAVVDFRIEPPSAPPMGGGATIREEEDEEAPRPAPPPVPEQQEPQDEEGEEGRGQEQQQGPESVTTRLLRETLGKQDVLTQTMCLLADRLSLIEDRLEGLATVGTGGAKA